MTTLKLTRKDFDASLRYITNDGPLDRTAEHNDRIADITEMILDTGIDMAVDDAWNLAAAIDAKFIVIAAASSERSEEI